MKRIITMALAVILLIGCLPLSVLAAETETQADGKPLGMASIASTGYVTMSTSQQMLDVLKVMEGFFARPYWDNSQWTVGYGSYAENNTITVTPDQAEQLLKTQLKEGYVTAAGTKSKGFEQYVNEFCQKIGKQPTQNQFDALVSFTYNLGAGWMSNSRLAAWLKKPTTELEFVDAMIQWSRAGGKLTYGLTQRRIREAIIFMKGEYYYSTKPTASYNVKSNLRVVSNSDLPYYASVIYQYDYTTSSTAKGNGNAVGAFLIGGVYDSLLVPTREGYRFGGWKITKINTKETDSGSVVNAKTVVQDNLELTALWVSPDGSPADDNSTTDNNSGGSPDEPITVLPFTDVSESAWYRKSVEFVYEKGLMNGTDDTAFNPEGTMTRGMLVTVLYRMDGSPSVTDEQRAAFTDISGAYYTDAVAWAKANNIVNGITDRKFCPNDNVTREQAVAIFHRYCVEYCKVDGSQSAQLDNNFTDTGRLSNYAVAPMQWAVAVELITGQSQNGKMYLNPKGNLTRCQSATILMRCVSDILS